MHIGEHSQHETWQNRQYRFLYKITRFHEVSTFSDFKRCMLEKFETSSLYLFKIHFKSRNCSLIEILLKSKGILAVYKKYQ